MAGIAYWINTNFNLIGTDKEIDKKSKLVADIKEWIDAEYENDRQTSISDMELFELVEKYSDLKRI